MCTGPVSILVRLMSEGTLTDRDRAICKIGTRKCISMVVTRSVQ